jgi:hypothetical protein
MKKSDWIDAVPYNRHSSKTGKITLVSSCGSCGGSCGGCSCGSGYLRKEQTGPLLQKETSDMKIIVDGKS